MSASTEEPDRGQEPALGDATPGFQASDGDEPSVLERPDEGISAPAGREARESARPGRPAESG